MTTSSIRYIGTEPLREESITGSKRVWDYGQIQTVDTAIATQLLTTGLFEDDAGVYAQLATDSSGNVTGLVGPGGVVVSTPWSVSSQTKGHLGARGCYVNCPSPTFAQSGNTYTWCLAVAIPADAIAVQLVAANAVTSAITGVSGAVSIGGTKTELLNNAGTWTAATWGSASTVSLTAGTTDTPAFTLSDWIPITPSVTTFTGSEGLALQMCYARIATPSANANVSLLGCAVASSSGWVTSVDEQVMALRYQIGDFVATPTGMTGSSNPANAPIVGVRYITASKNCVQVMALGDSIEFGAGLTPVGYTWGHIACNNLSTDKIYSFINHGYSGQTTTKMLARARVVIPQFRPNVVFLPAFSPNDGTPTQAIINTQIYNIRMMAQLCLDNGALPIILEGLPKTTNSSNVASSYTAGQDALRTALNAMHASGAIVYVRHGLGNGASPELWGSASYTSDGTHPSDAGVAIITANVQAAISAAGF